MIYNVLVLPVAQRDIARLRLLLIEKSRRAADRATRTLEEAIESLKAFPLRTPAKPPHGLHELVVRFGHDGYVIRYQVREADVIVIRIFHGKERR